MVALVNGRSQSRTPLAVGRLPFDIARIAGRGCDRRQFGNAGGPRQSLRGQAPEHAKFKSALLFFRAADAR
jgi:hypothetical protein